MRIRRARVWVTALVTGLVVTLLLSGMGVPEPLLQRASAAAPEPEPSVKGRPVPKPKVSRGADESAPAVRTTPVVWPAPGRAEVAVTSAPARAGALPVRIASARSGGGIGKVKVETLAPDTVRKLGGVGVAARIERADGRTGPGKVRAEFSYAGFRDAYGGNLATRLQVVRLPACAVQTPRPRTCVARPQEVATTNDLKAGALAAEVELGQATPVQRPAPAGGDRKAAARAAAEATAARQMAEGSVYMLTAALIGPNGNFGATDLKPSGTWQAGTSGGSFSYDYPLPEAPSPAGDGPDLSLAYDASSVDGQGNWTNNQSGVVGLGWELNTGFIERHFRRCVVDNYYDNQANLIWTAEERGIAGKALCWESPDVNDGDPATNDMSRSDLVLHVGGRSAQIVKDRTSGVWRTVPDFGWKVEHLAGGADGQEYWQVTSAAGQVYRFGYTKDAQWQVPYIGNDLGEPCYDRYYNNSIPPTCTGVWRWNLDRSVDRNENVVDYTYTAETNHFCLPSCLHELNRVLPYQRGGFLAKVEWGHNTQVAGSVPTTLTYFNTSDRGTLDVPGDMRCDVPAACANSTLAFYSTRKLDSLLTQARDPVGQGWDWASRLDLTYTWMYTRTDFGQPYDPVMWLDTVQQVGLAGATTTLPAVDFDAVMLAGKMSYDDMSDWLQKLSWRMVPRISAIANGMGGRIEVSYGQADHCSGGNGRDGGNYFNDYVGDCYKIDQSIIHNKAWTVYYKQLVTKVVERDLVAASPDVVNGYEYRDGPGWASPRQHVEPNRAPPLSDWRGYGTVRTTQGSGTHPSDFTVTSQTFFRGTGGALTNFEGGVVTDTPALQGQTLQEQSWKLTTLTPHAYEEVESTRYEYLVRHTGSGTGVHDPAFILRVKERSRERVTGGTWRWTEQHTGYNADGLPATVNDHGDTATAADNTCTSTTYARNVTAGQWFTSLPSTVEHRAGDSCATGAMIGKTVSLYDGGSDPATNTPSDGNTTETRTYADATTVSTTKATYDDYGRPLTATDAANKITTTAYNPAVGWPHLGVTVTNPLGHTVTTTSSYLIGLPVSLVDANGKLMEIDYDALGRTTTLWGPDEPRGGGTPTATVAYDVSATAPARTTMRKLLSGTGTTARYLTTHSYEDGLGRTREAQTESPAGGRMVVATVYDARGLGRAVSQPVHNTAAPGTDLLNPALTSLPQWTETLYDGLERPIAAIEHSLATELRRTTTAYPGADRVEVTPPVGGKTVTVSDAADRTVRTEEWKDATVHHDTTYDYTVAGLPHKITDANGNVRTFTHDWMGRRTAATDPDSGNTTTHYDAAGHILWSVDGNNSKISYSYDDLGRRTAQWIGEPTTGTKAAEWVYDTVAKGQPTSSTRYTAGNAYTDAVTAYDNSYRPTATRTVIPASEGALAGTYVFTAAYDRAGNLTGQDMPAGGGLAAESLTLSYTDLGLPKTLTSNLSGTTTYVKDTLYTATARLSERHYGANAQVKRSFTWDAGTGWLNRLTTTAKADTPTPQLAQDDHFTYNADGEITRILDAASAAGGSPGQSECFTYDGLSRLTAAFTTTGSSCAAGADTQGVDPYNHGYTYDAVGNLTGLTEDGTTATYTYPTPGAAAVRPNGVTAVTRPGRTDTYGYDNAGQMTARTVAGKQATFTWNPLGELEKAIVDGRQTSMVYDADGDRLIRRDPDGSATLYLGSMELKLSGAAVQGTRYYTGPDGSVVAMRTTSGVKWLASGLHGSTQLAVDDATGQVSRERYLPYGKRRGTDDLPFTDRGFLGKIEDDSTGLDYLSARYYDPSIARFISTDPLLNLDKPQWINPYSYAGNNPIGLSDPTGLKPASHSGKADPCTKPNSRACKLQRKHQAEANAAAAKAEVDRQFKLMIDAVVALAKIAADELGITAGIQCFTSGNLGACGETALNVLSSLAGGLVGKLAAKYALPWKWKRAYELGREVWRHAGDAISGFRGWLAAKDKLKIAEKAREAAQQAYAACGRPKVNSFVPGTPVLMADGTHKPIEEVKVGDKVLATDPETGRSEAKPVVDLIAGEGVKNLVRITVDTDGAKGGRTGVVIATDEHPFWVADLREWVPATRLTPGTWLRTSAGTHVRVTAVTKWTTPHQKVHNLTVADTHTYHVTTGEADVLVHNENVCDNEAFSGLSRSQQRAVRSYQKRIEEHEAKLAAYRKNPDAFDNQGLLARAPSREVRERIIASRIRHLEREIQTFKDNIKKITGR